MAPLAVFSLWTLAVATVDGTRRGSMLQASDSEFIPTPPPRGGMVGEIGAGLFACVLLLSLFALLTLLAFATRPELAVPTICCGGCLIAVLILILTLLPTDAENREEKSKNLKRDRMYWTRIGVLLVGLLTLLIALVGHILFNVLRAGLPGNERQVFHGVPRPSRGGQQQRLARWCLLQRYDPTALQFIAEVG
eukprot:Hpha_TRINITY_DN15603_c0_g5::TRINITY_DN15603_c0_g5_i1::g.98511::m.98511